MNYGRDGKGTLKKEKELQKQRTRMNEQEQLDAKTHALLCLECVRANIVHGKTEWGEKCHATSIDGRCAICRSMGPLYIVEIPKSKPESKKRKAPTRKVENADSARTRAVASVKKD